MVDEPFGEVDLGEEVLCGEEVGVKSESLCYSIDSSLTH